MARKAAKKTADTAGTAPSAAKKKGTRTTKAKTGAAQAAKRGIDRAADHHHFVLVDGRRLADIKELADALEDMADHVWGHHVGENHNHFAVWVHDVFEDKELAERLKAAAGKHHAQIVLYRTILERI